MKKFERIKIFNKRYTNELENDLKLIMPKIIEAFVKVYGEKHRDYITYTLNNIKFVFFISEKLLCVANEYYRGIRKRDKYILDYYLKYLEYIDFMSISISEKELYKFIYNNFITKSDLNFRELKDNSLLANDDPIFSFAVTDDSDLVKVIELPIFVVDIKTVFHELNHALDVDLLAFNENKIISFSLFTNETTEELLNDYIADLALKEFKGIGGIIPKSLKRFKILNKYEYNYYIVKHLFDALSPLILESYISKRLNLFTYFSGKNNHSKLNDLINDLFNNGFDLGKYNELRKIVDDIENNILTKDIIESEFYLNEFELNGMRLKRMNKKQ